MGPTNTALLNYYRSDQSVREAREKLDAAGKNVRVQQRKVNDLAAKRDELRKTLKETQAKIAANDVDVKARQAKIDHLREQQNASRNNKEYQAFLIEINTGKVDKAKVEEELFKLMESAEKMGAELKDVEAHHGQESTKAEEMKGQITDRLASLQAEVDKLSPEREELGSKLPSNVRHTFDVINDRLEGDGMAAIQQHDMRRAEYSCTACNLELVVDTFNKLLTRDQIVFCPSCRRVLFIPEGMAKEVTTTSAAGKKKTTTTKRAPRAKKGAKVTTGGSTDVRIENKWFDLLTKSQGESVRNARDADQSPLECSVTINGETIGTYKGKSADNLTKIILFNLEEQKLTADVVVTPVGGASAEATAAGEPDRQPGDIDVPLDSSNEQPVHVTSGQADQVSETLEPVATGESQSPSDKEDEPAVPSETADDNRPVESTPQ